ncbi:MAG: hypothetical protein PHR56_06140 [Dehalococcoidales bacterium]|nr:hypothetical protein [Dehalococcoidales bacterium]
MTVCIAALYGNGAGCVLVSDQMITAHFPMGYEFENDEVEKIVKIQDTGLIHALISGNVLFANEVIQKAKEQLTAKGVNVVDVVADIVRDSYRDVRLMHASRNELESRGLNLQTYYQRQQSLFQPLVQILDNALRTYDLGVQFLVAGKGEKSCHVFSVTNPGDSICHDTLGYAVIGSGAPHAMYHLIESGYKKSMNKDDVLKVIKAAKKRSEVAPGVGKADREVII